MIDAAPLYTFHHDEVHLTQPRSGIVIALVGLLRILRVSKLSAEFKDMTPKSVLATSSANSARKAQVLHRKRKEKTTSSNSSP